MPACRDPTSSRFLSRVAKLSSRCGPSVLQAQPNQDKTFTTKPPDIEARNIDLCR
jgi:hypothetical protein